MTHMIKLIYTDLVGKIIDGNHIYPVESVKNTRKDLVARGYRRISSETETYRDSIGTEVPLTTEIWEREE